MRRRSSIGVDWPTFLGAVFFILIGGGFATFGGYQLWTTYAFVSAATPVTATVIENPESCDDDGDCTWWPRLRFEDAKGVTYEAETRFGASNYGWNEGAEIKALYNPGYPYLRIPGVDNLYLLGGAFFALGMLPVFIALWLLIKVTFTRDSNNSAQQKDTSDTSRF